MLNTSSHKAPAEIAKEAPIMGTGIPEGNHPAGMGCHGGMGGHCENVGVGPAGKGCAGMGDQPIQGGPAQVFRDGQWQNTAPSFRDGPAEFGQSNQDTEVGKPFEAKDNFSGGGEVK